ncbi:nicotinamide riboside transporter PnuC [Paraflavitalea pollutisoli]|uniref:nicotinamide riboside transporter PnuC n=1 Tax=Paraflavitalea pollutisoli TaxID=3034143 RepID=UPI0023ED79A2|nr:nicotinamide riboside transporter PnuC [Paraflavitalea sp. H1-2-19X]
MSISEIYEKFIDGMLRTTLLEYVAVFTGIASVWFSRIENIWVYPVGLVSTIIYTYLSLTVHLPGEATVNIYYSAMSVYGWILWAKKDRSNHHVVVIQHATGKEWLHHLLFFSSFYLGLFSALTWLHSFFSTEIIPWADALASATAFTGMWLMAKKKVESWFWWIATNISSIPLYFVKGYVFTSVFYFILLLMAGFGWAEWNKRAYQARQGRA